MWINQLFSYWTRQLFAPGTLLRKKYQYFRDLLALDRYCLEKMAEIEEIYYRGSPCDYARVIRLCRELDQGVGNLIKSIIALNPIRYRVLKEYHRKVSFYLENSLSIDEPPIGPPFVVGLDPENGQGQNASLIGGKALNLSIIKEKNIPAPEGFCITTRAYNAIVAANGLRPRINDTLSRVCLDSIENLEEKCHTLQQLFLDAQIPDHIQKEIDGKLIGFPGKKLAVRSSAFGEDGGLSFAGQYKSLLNVSPENFTDAYKQVLAGKYSPRAITYRIHEGLPDESLPMAVLVLEMIDARESGVVYSSGIKDKDEMGIYIVSGLGDKLVSGEAAAREIYIDKKKDFDFSSGHQPYIKELYDQALKLEQLFENPQDVEWAVDKAGSLKLLQTRPLHAIKPLNDAPRLDLPVLAKGEWASPGLVSGKIFTLKPDKGIHSDISKIPKGAVVVVGGLYPELTAGLGNIGGIIAREGSAAGHFATIARESSIPIVINVAKALEMFEDGQLVTIDGNRGLVHDGKADQTTLYPVKKETWLTGKMEKIIEIVSSLNLKDAQSEEFIPQNCRSMHDLIRFIHEMGVREMFSLSERKGRGLYQAKVLDIDIPMSFRVLNLENGLTDKGDAQRRISLNDVICEPFKAMFTGLTHEKIEWDQNIKHFDWEEFDKVSAGVFNPAESALLSSYGLLAKDYMHALIRFGYHFVVVDSLLVEEPEQNYIQFSFKGGGGERSQKEMRLETIRIVLEKYGFDIVVRGDLLEAQYERKNYEDTKRRLTVIGFVLGRTRLMDMSMSPEKVKSIAETLTGEIDEILAV